MPKLSGMPKISSIPKFSGITKMITGNKKTNNNKKYNENEVAIMINSNLNSNIIVNSNNDYNKTLKKIKSIYKMLHSKNNINNQRNNLKNIIKNEELVELFRNDDELNNKFKKNSSPFSDYNFFYGLDNTNLRSKEEFTKKAMALKFSFVGIVLAFPSFATVLFGSFASGGVLLAMVASVILARKALNFYREYIIKRISSNKVFFCTKYLPYDNITAFRSRLYEKYHKLFYYNINNNNDKKKSIEDFLNFIIDKKSDEKKKFEDKVINYLNNINNFIKFIIKNNKKNMNELGKIVDKNTLKELISSLDNDNEKGDPYLNSDSITTQINTTQINTTQMNTAQMNTTQISSTKMSNNNISNIITNNNKIATEKVVQYGGVQEEILRSLGSDLDKDYVKLSSSLFVFNSLSIMNYRLNYKINEKLILTSTDITINMIENELMEILKSYGTFLRDETAIMSKKNIFFINYTLIDLLKDLKKVKNPETLKFNLINFIAHYLESFLYLYLISEYNIKTLITGGNKTLLDSMFDYNLKQTVAGRYRFTNRMTGSMSNITFETIKRRDKINYFSILMKHSYLALDHIFKRLKLIIKENEGIKINNNISTNIFEYNKCCEDAIFYYVKNGTTYDKKQEIKKDTFSLKEKMKSLRPDYSKVSYNKDNYKIGIMLEDDINKINKNINLN